MVSYFDHKTKTVPRPTILLDKQTNDAHDNPVISIDDEGHIWIFSTSHGTSRPSYIHRSKRPYDIDEFELVPATRRDGGKPSRSQLFLHAGVASPAEGFLCFFTRYNYPAKRTICFMTSPDGVQWSAVAATGGDRRRALSDQRRRQSPKPVRCSTITPKERAELADQSVLHRNARLGRHLADGRRPTAAACR